MGRKRELQEPPAISDKGLENWEGLLSDAALRIVRTARVGQSLPLSGRTRVAQLQLATPSLMSESELLNLMDKNGIGTDASMPTHIHNIVLRGYVKVVGTARRQLQPTMLGYALFRGLLAIDRELVRPAVRARIEHDVSEIANGQRSCDEVVWEALSLFRDKFLAVRAGMPRLLEELKWT